MPLEIATHIADLVATNPDGTDDKSQGDDHIRQLKSVLKNTFPNLSRAVTIKEHSWADKSFEAVTKDANYGMSVDDDGGAILFTCTTGTRSYNLTAFASTPDGFCVFIDRDGGANNLSLVPNGTEQINSGGAGVAFVLTAGENGFLYKGASEWRFVASRLIASSSRLGDVELALEAEFITGTSTTLVPPVSVVRKHTRERLYANRTYYVRTDGNNANTGLVDSAGGAWQTLQFAGEFVQRNIDFNGFNVTVQVKDGTYAPAGSVLDLAGICVGQPSTSAFKFLGNEASPGNVILVGSAANCINLTNGAFLNMSGFEFRTNTSGNGVSLFDGAKLTLGVVRFGTIVGRQVQAYSGGKVYLNSNYSIVGGAERHFFAAAGGYIEALGLTITLSGTPAFSQQFARASNNGTIYAPSNVFSGSATGQRYVAVQGGIIDTEGGGANYLPGNSAGSITTPGGYF